MKIRVIPIYGYGWSNGESFGDVPSPFELDVCQSTLISNLHAFDLIVGKIQRPHAYEDLWALLYARTMEAEPNYNIGIYTDKITVAEGARNLPTIKPRATGFAILDVDLDDASENSR